MPFFILQYEEAFYGDDTEYEREAEEEEEEAEEAVRALMRLLLL